jgi:hypothetical protein
MEELDMRFPSRKRTGAQILVLSLTMGLLATFWGMSVAQRGHDAQRWIYREKLQLVARDLLHSSLEEATHAFMEQVNVPGTLPLDAVRQKPGDDALVWSVSTPASVELVKEQLPGMSLAVKVSVVERAPISTSYEPESEWRGVLVVQASVAGASGARFAATQSRDVRACLITPPRPMDLIGFYDWHKPQPGQPEGPFTMDLSYWRAKSTMCVTPTTGVSTQNAFQMLKERLGVLNGVINVRNRDGGALKLRDYNHLGKAVLVVEGAVELEDVKLQDPRSDLLTVIAFGDVQVRGRADVALIMTADDKAALPVRALNGAVDVRGSLIMTCGTCTTSGVVTLYPNFSHLAAGKPGSQNPLPDRIYVSVSPQLYQDRMVIW